MPAPRTNPADLKMRVEYVLRLRLEGATSWDIVSAVSADGDPYPKGHGRAWGVCERTVRRYLRLSDRLLARMAAERAEASLNRFLVQRRQLYNRALQMGDVRAALAASDSEAKLLGLFDPKRTPAAHDDDVAALSDAELEAVVRGSRPPPPDAGRATGEPGEAVGGPLGSW